MEFNIFDIYADASINLETKLGCSGIILVDRKKDKIIDERYYVKIDATNNMCEIIAIWMAIYRAIELLYSQSLPFQVNIFSDSQISLFGIRDWITTWVANRKGNTLINSSGSVSNQEWFSDSYYAIISSGIKLKFFHQKGHVDANNYKSIYASDKLFRTANGITMNMAGTTPQVLAKYNNLVDNHSRDIIIGIVNGTITIADAKKVLKIPMIYIFEDSSIQIYESLTKGGLNYPIHFNGGC